MTVTILYFGSLKDDRGKGEEVWTSTAPTPRELYLDLRSLHRLSLDFDQVKVAINHEFADEDSLLQEGDAVAFLPPVSGG